MLGRRRQKEIRFVESWESKIIYTGHKGSPAGVCGNGNQISGLPVTYSAMEL